MEDGEDRSLTSHAASRHVYGLMGQDENSTTEFYIRLADLQNRVGKLRDSKSYCENALRVYLKPSPGTLVEEVVTAFIETSAMCQSMNELDKSIKMLTRAWKIYANAPGQQNTVAGIEAQRGVVSYMMGIALNQIGLACIQRYEIHEGADLFEEAKTILEIEYGPCIYSF